MKSFLKQNKHILIISIAIFMGSLSLLLFFMNEESPAGEIKADVVSSSISLKNSQEEEEKYREMVGNEEDTIMIVGLDGKISLVSWDFEATSGYKESDLQHKLFFNLLHPDDLGIFLSAFGTVIESEKPLIMVGPYRLRDINGQYHYHMGSLYPFKKGPKVLKVIITTRDISDTLKNSKEDSKAKKESSKSFPSSQPKIRNQKEGGETKLMIEKLLSAHTAWEQ